jgi:MFS family permease
MTVGSIAATLLVLAWSQVTSLPQLYLIWSAIGLTMSVTLYDPAFATASTWFDRQRVRALTLITLMAGFASTIFIPLAGWLVQVQGWRPSLLTLAVILAIGTIPPHALLLRRRPADLGLHPDGKALSERTPVTSRQPAMAVSQALRHRSFGWLVTAFWFSTIATIAVGVHVLPYLQDRGYDATFAATVTGLIGAMQVLARLLLAPFGNRAFGQPQVTTALILALQPLSLVMLLLVRSTLGVVLFVILFGAQRGLSTLARPAMVAHLYGGARFASIAGVLQFAISLAQAAAPVGAGVGYDLLHSYEPIFWTLAALSGVAALAVLRARPEPEAAILSRP